MTTFERDVLGQVMVIGDQPFRIVGIMQRKRFSEDGIGDVRIANRNRDVYLPAQFFAVLLPSRNAWQWSRCHFSTHVQR